MFLFFEKIKNEPKYKYLNLKVITINKNYTMYDNLVNKEHWDNFNKGYSNNWRGTSKEALSQRETGFINKYLIRNTVHKILDIGVGNGRIMQNLVEKSSDEVEIYGIDLSEKMVDLCKQRFEEEKKVKSIRVCDVSVEGVCFEHTFDFVSAVRVIKYNKNWVKMIENIHNKLNKNGIFIFSMLNNNSLSRFADYRIPIYLAGKKEIEAILRNMNFEILEISSFSKLPAFLYLIDNNFYSKVLIGIEKFLDVLLGKALFGKEFFIAVKK